jgi:hypothetical protein
MTDKPSIESLPFEVNGVENDDGVLELTYRNEIGNSITRRTYHKSNGIVHESDQEWMYDYVQEKWKLSHQFTRDYELGPNNERLVGDGSGWDGTGKKWRSWFKRRHLERLKIRYRHDAIPEYQASNPQAA